MYKRILRPLLFLLPPETVHDLIVSMVRTGHRIPGVKRLLRSAFSFRHPRLGKEVLGLWFENPVGLAAGFDKNASFFKAFRMFGFGFIEVGTVTPEPQPGNPRPRSFRLPRDKALINRMGFNNLGVEAAVKRLKSRSEGYIVGGNIGKNTLTPNDRAVDDYARCFDQLYDHVDYFVVNVSCPNISDMAELQDEEKLREILRRLVGIRETKQVRKPVLLKISPDLNWKQIDESLLIIRETGLDGIVATNTTITRDHLETPGERIKQIGRGGLSGSPLRDRSTEVIRYIRRKTGPGFPIIGVGGIMTVQDALDKIDAGADLLQIYTGFIYEGPCFVRRILRRLSALPPNS